MSPYRVVQAPVIGRNFKIKLLSEAVFVLLNITLLTGNKLYLLYITYFIILVPGYPGLDFRCMAWAWHGHGIQGMAPSAPIERGAARRGATSLNFAANSIAPRGKKVRPTQLANRPM